MQQIQLSEDFDAPAIRARFDVLTLLASSLQPFLKELRRASDGEPGPEWHTLVTILASKIGSQLSQVVSFDAAPLIWNQFLSDVTVARAGPRVKVVLGKIEGLMKERLKVPHVLKQYLSEANELAASWISALLEDHKIPIGVVNPAPLRVHWDPLGEQYCASSSALGGQISWGFQLLPYSFYAALIATLVLEHEYLSHLIPENRWLSRGVRETWLTLTVTEEHLNGDADRELAHIRQYLWTRFRFELTRHFGRNDVELFGPLGLDRLTSIVRFRSPRWFWDLTGEMLTMRKDEEGEADTMNTLLERMLALPDPSLRRVLSKQPRGRTA